MDNPIVNPTTAITINTAVTIFSNGSLLCKKKIIFAIAVNKANAFNTADGSNSFK